MTGKYKINYSDNAYEDLRKIYTYIANNLLAPETATVQVNNNWSIRC